MITISIERPTTFLRSARKTGPEQVLHTYAKLPIAFVENRGQTDARVRFYAQGERFAFFLTPGEVVLRFSAPSPASNTSGHDDLVMAAAKTPDVRGTTLGLRFLASNPNVEIAGEDRAPGEVNYFRGGDSNHWQTRLVHYSQISYRELWRGIDLRLREQEGKLKYEFRVKPGANVPSIRLAYDGADHLTLADTGELLVATPLGVLRDAPPVVYQEIGGLRVPVESRYVLSNGGYGFAVSGYDQQRDLIIHPGLDFSTYLGGTSHESGAGIAVDAAGNAYIVGITHSTRR